MIRLFFILFVLAPGCVKGQKKESPSSIVPEDTVIYKWTKAIINIEVRSGEIKKRARDSILSNHKGDLKGLFSLLDSVNKIVEPGNFGTAIFLTYDKHYFLITARHVLEGQIEIPINEVLSKSITLITNASESLKTENVIETETGLIGNLGEMFSDS